MSLCLTCSSSIREGEHAHAHAHTTPCCAKPLCRACVARNPRLAVYDPCLACGDLTTPAGLARVREGRERAGAERARREDVFVLGDEEEGQEEEEEAGAGTEPPPYEAVDGDRDRARSAGGRDADRSDPDDGSDAGDGDEDREDEGRADGPATPSAAAEHAQHAVAVDPTPVEVEVRHPVARGDTILSIARRYAADPHEVLRLNDLPPAVLSSQPHLLRTRKTLLIARRHVPRAHAPSATLFAAPPPPADRPDAAAREGEGEGEGETDREADRKRERERAVKRFQLLTKSIDPRVGDAYIALSELDEDPGRMHDLAALEIDQWEATQGGGPRRAPATAPGVREKGKMAPPAPSNREQRALDAFYDDEQWESEAGGPSRSRNGGWRVVGDPAKLGVKV